MPNDPPYGGRIEVKPNGSVTWAVSAREYPSYRDIDGTVEFAIRVVDKDRNIITSSDGKCIVHVHTDEIESENRHLRFLIVSGYDMPAAPDNTTIVGKSYFVTMNRFSEFAEVETLPRYDLILQYDDYDLEEADLPRNLEPMDLHVCHENWFSVSELWNTLIKYTPIELALTTNDVPLSKVDRQGTQQALGFQLSPVSVMATVERKLRESGVNRDLWDILDMLVKASTPDLKNDATSQRTDRQDTGGPQNDLQQANDQSTTTSSTPPSGIGTINTDLWVSRWHEVVEHHEDTGCNGDNKSGARGQNQKLATTSAPMPKSEEELRREIEAKVKEIIDEKVVQGHRVESPPGSRVITVKDIRDRGLFVLMYHGPSEKHSGSDH